MKKLLLFSFFFLFSLLCTAQEPLVFKPEKIDVKGANLISSEELTYKAFSVGELISVNIPQYRNLEYAEKSRTATNQIYEKNKKFNDEPPQFNYMPFIINAGMGFSLISLELPGIHGGFGGPNILSESPAYNCTLDYRLINFLSIGMGGSYQSLKDYPAIVENYYATWEEERISRYQISGILEFHFLKRSQNDLYAGFRIGESMWTEQILYNNLGISQLWRTFSQKATSISYQVFFGYRYFIINNVGIHFEAAIGSPYLFEGGLTFKINTRKSSYAPTPQDNYGGHEGK